MRCVHSATLFDCNGTYVRRMIIVMGCIRSFLVGVPLIIEKERVIYCYNFKSS